MSEKKYWPFDLPTGVKLTAQQQSEMEFLQNCHQLGFRAYLFGAGNYGVENNHGRVGEIIKRGPTRWEFVLAEYGEKISSKITSDFTEAAQLVQNWLGVAAGQVLQAG